MTSDQPREPGEPGEPAPPDRHDQPAGGFVPGLGHPVHKAGDPRTYPERT